MNKIFNPERAQWKTVLKRPTQSVSDIEDIVNSVFREIKAGGIPLLVAIPKSLMVWS